MTTPKEERLVELLTARALWGLGDAEGRELAALLDEQVGVDDRTFDAAAAAVEVAHARLEPMPTALAQRLQSVAPGAGGGVVSLEGARKRRALAWSGWIAAAACLVLAIGAWLRRPPVGTEADALAARAALLRTAKDAVVMSWTTTKDPAAAGATGDVVWSEVEQRGFMRFHGLAANDAAREQYQLWIFDRAQDERYPVDGGVFDVDRTTGDVVVPIRAKLHVVEPTLFAVTVEKPGGVVVSKRERIVVTAALKTG